MSRFVNGIDAQEALAELLERRGFAGYVEELWSQREVDTIIANKQRLEWYERSGKVLDRALRTDEPTRIKVCPRVGIVGVAALTRLLGAVPAE